VYNCECTDRASTIVVLVISSAHRRGDPYLQLPAGSRPHDL